MVFNYIASAIDMVTNNSSHSSRQIAGVSTGGCGGGARGRGRGNNGGRHGRGRGSRGRGRGRSNYIQGDQTTQNSTDNRPLSRGYSREEWQNLSQAEKNRIFRARERLEMARTVAAMLRDENGGQDDLSALTGPESQAPITPPTNANASVAGATRSISQVSLENASQAFNRRRLNAYTTGSRTAVDNSTHAREQ